MTPSEVGTRSEAAVIHALASLGKQPLLPFGPRRYDVAYEEDGRLVKVQCKTGRVVGGAIEFPTSSQIHGTRRGYAGEIDLFGVYCSMRDEIYLVPVEDVPARAARLRLDEPRNGQKRGIRWASDYLVTTHTPKVKPLPYQTMKLL